MTKKFTIEMNRWLRGLKDGRGLANDSPYLLDGDNQMCCLGFMMQQMGATDDMLHYVGEPAEVCFELENVKNFEPLISFDEEEYLKMYEQDEEPEVNAAVGQSGLTYEAIKINDNPEISDSERMQKLRDLFAPLDIELEFV